jgi:hypothetical protein
MQVFKGYILDDCNLSSQLAPKNDVIDRALFGATTSTC